MSNKPVAEIPMLGLATLADQLSNEAVGLVFLNNTQRMEVPHLDTMLRDVKRAFVAKREKKVHYILEEANDSVIYILTELKILCRKSGLAPKRQSKSSHTSPKSKENSEAISRLNKCLERRGVEFGALRHQCISNVLIEWKGSGRAGLEEKESEPVHLASADICEKLREGWMTVFKKYASVTVQRLLKAASWAFVPQKGGLRKPPPQEHREYYDKVKECCKEMEEAIPYEAKRIWQSFKDIIPWENYVQFPDYAAFIDYLDTLDRLEDFLRDQVTKYFESIQVNNDGAEEAKPTEELRIAELHELVGDFRKLFEAFNEVNLVTICPSSIWYSSHSVCSLRSNWISICLRLRFIRHSLQRARYRAPFFSQRASRRV